MVDRLQFCRSCGRQDWFPAARGLCSVRIYFDLGADLCTSADSALCESDQCDSEKCADPVARKTAVYAGDGCDHCGGCGRIGLDDDNADVRSADVVLFRRIADRMAQFLYPSADLCDI